MGIQKSPGDASFSALYNKCKHAAKQRNIKFSLSRSQHRELITMNCHYCGHTPIPYNSYLKNKGKDQVRKNRYSRETIKRNWIRANGVDRVDNSVGYIDHNCVPCCAQCNYMKCDMEYDAFTKWIKQVFYYLGLGH